MPYVNESILTDHCIPACLNSSTANSIIRDMICMWSETMNPKFFHSPKPRRQYSDFYFFFPQVGHFCLMLLLKCFWRKFYSCLVFVGLSKCEKSSFIIQCHVRWTQTAYGSIHSKVLNHAEVCISSIQRKSESFLKQLSEQLSTLKHRKEKNK